MRKAILALALLFIIPQGQAIASPWPVRAVKTVGSATKQCVLSAPCLTGLFIIAGSIELDAKSTVAYKKVCPACSDNNIFIQGQNFGTAAIWRSGLYSFLIEGSFQIATSALAGRDGGWWWTALGNFGIPASSLVQHVGLGAIHNYRLAAQCKSAKLDCN